MIGRQSCPKPLKSLAGSLLTSLIVVCRVSWSQWPQKTFEVFCVHCVWCNANVLRGSCLLSKIGDVSDGSPCAAASSGLAAPFSARMGDPWKSDGPGEWSEDASGLLAHCSALAGLHTHQTLWQLCTGCRAYDCSWLGVVDQANVPEACAQQRDIHVPRRGRAYYRC